MRHVQTPYPVHSLAEIALSLKVMACPHCSGGPLGTRTRRFHCDARTGRIDLEIVCRSCQKSEPLFFSLADSGQAASAPWPRLFNEETILATAESVNPTPRSSALIDVAGWLMLHSLLTDKARTESVHARSSTERNAVRNLQILAGQCIDEALKFYDVDNDLPPSDAFFSEAGKIQFHAYPELFVRDRLIDLRSRLPSRVPRIRTDPTSSNAHPPRRWWQFWKRR